LLLGCKHYTRAIDIWAVGCIFAELLLISDALFPGKEAKGFQRDQLERIFDVLGKPTSADWEGITDCPYYFELEKKDWPKSQYCLPEKIAEKIPFLPSTSKGFDLLQKMLAFDPTKRITAEKALGHEYFMESPIPAKNAFKCENETDIMYPPRVVIAGKTVPPKPIAEVVQNMPPPYGRGRGRGRGSGITGRGRGARGRGGRQTGVGRGRGRGTMIDTQEANLETEAKTFASYNQMSYSQPMQQAYYNYQQSFNQSQFLTSSSINPNTMTNARSKGKRTMSYDSHTQNKRSR